LGRFCRSCFLFAREGFELVVLRLERLSEKIDTESWSELESVSEFWSELELELEEVLLLL